MALPRLQKDAIKMYGVFGLRVFELRGGKFVQTRRIQKKNQITNQGRSNVLNLLCPATFGYDGLQDELKIKSIAVGTNSTPPTVADDDTTMVTVWREAFDYISDCVVINNPPNDFMLSITKELPTTEANGSTLTEAGIFTRGDENDPDISVGMQLYARQVHSPIIKTSVMSILYDWQLGITIQS